MAKAVLWMQERIPKQLPIPETLPREYLALEIEDLGMGHWWDPVTCRRCKEPRGEHEWLVSIGVERVLDCSTSPRFSAGDPWHPF